MIAQDSVKANPRRGKEKTMAKPFVIFLDLDGPVCNHRSNYATGDQFDPISAGMIARLCRDTGAKLVISSARRRDDGLVDKLASLGLAVHLFDHPDDWRTGHDRMAIRGNEIDAWHAAHPGHAYAILDDERGGIHPHQLPYLVHTDMHAGTSMRDIYRLQRLMGQDVSDRDIDGAGAQYPRITIAQIARDATKALDQGDDDLARDLLARISDHPLAQ